MFLILGLPRSRTAWLANLFTRGDSLCYHELSGRRSSAAAMAEELLSSKARFVGNSDSGSVQYATELKRLIPELRVVLVRRKWEDALDAFIKVLGCDEEGPLAKLANFAGLDHTLDLLAHDALNVKYEDLAQQEVIESIWHYCLGDSVEFPQAQYDILQSLNVQMEPALMRRALYGDTTLPGRLLPLTHAEEDLLNLVYEGHAKSTLNADVGGSLNISSSAVCITASGNGSLVNSLAAAILSLGGRHGPIIASCDLLSREDLLGYVEDQVGEGHRIPGWGNDFFRGFPNPHWTGVDSWLKKNAPRRWAKIN
jgi:hypothetical protein